jgi:protein TonB
LVTVTAQGEVCKVAVKRSSGYRILDRAAVKAIYRWQFQAAHQNGLAVAGQVIVPIRFDIKEMLGGTRND